MEGHLPESQQYRPSFLRSSGQGLADSVGSVWKVICQSLSSICLLFFVPVDSDLANILACRYSENCTVIKEILLCFEFLPVYLYFRITKVFSDDYISSGYVLDGHHDVIKPCSAESLGLNELLVSLDDLYAASDDCFSYSTIFPSSRIVNALDHSVFRRYPSEGLVSLTRYEP